jgi:hypothetical protein
LLTRLSLENRLAINLILLQLVTSLLTKPNDIIFSPSNCKKFKTSKIKSVLFDHCNQILRVGRSRRVNYYAFFNNGKRKIFMGRFKKKIAYMLFLKLMLVINKNELKKTLVRQVKHTTELFEDLIVIRKFM